MPLSVDDLFEANRDALQLGWLAGAAGGDRRISRPARRDILPIGRAPSDDAQPPAPAEPLLSADDNSWLTTDDTINLEAADLVGHLNLVHPGRIHVLGHEEAAYMERLGGERRRHLTDELLASRPPAIIYAEELQPSDALRTACEAEAQPLLSSRLPSARVIDSLRAYLTKALAQPVSKHGVFLDVLGMGVLISGESGLGKSELALELISRGHGLVADDVVDLTRVGPHTVEGRCPPMLQNFLEVRGLGLLDIRTIFGETAVRRKMRLKLIVHLVRRSTMENEYERLPLEALTEDVLGVPIRKVVIPVAAGRNLAVLTEAAVRNTILQLRGIDSTRSFLERQRTEIERDR